MKKLALVLMAVALLLPLMAACAPKATPSPTPAPQAAPAPRPKLKPQTLAWGTMTPGASQYIWATAISTTIMKHSDLKISVEPWGDAGMYMKLFGTGDVHLGMTSQTEGLAAWKGWGQYKPQPIRQIASGIALGFMVVSVNPNVRTWQDMKGKRFYGMQPPESGWSLKAQFEALLEAHGVNPKDVEILPVPAVGEATRGLVEGKADGIYFGLAPFLDDLRRSKTLYNIPIEHEKLKAMAAKLPGILPATWRAGQFGATADSPIHATVFALYSHRDLDEVIVYRLLQTMYDNHAEMVAMSPLLREWSLEFGTRLNTVPYHPGAIKYFQEKGKWTAEIDTLQKKLLAEEK